MTLLLRQLLTAFGGHSPPPGGHSPYFRASLLFGSIVLVAGCASSAPAPSSGTATGPQQTEQSQADSGHAQTRVEPERMEPDTGNATLALLQQSDRAAAGGSITEAIAYTERAVRIEPRHADLWIKLAGLQLANNNPAAATQYARKALTLAGDRIDWQRQAWLIIADASQAQGRNEEARTIREQWQTARG